MAFAGALSGQSSTARSLPKSLPKLGLALLLAVSVGVPGHARGPVSDAAVVSRAELPREARQTEQLIRSGGPFPFAKDSSVFGNRERQLPRQNRGYYREYTVKTPGSRDRGARRIVCGGRETTAPEACFYSVDHYASFKRIVQ